jgi:hypothetical protein
VAGQGWGLAALLALRLLARPRPLLAPPSPTQPMRILDLFSGTHSPVGANAARPLGHEVVTLDRFRTRRTGFNSSVTSCRGSRTRGGAASHSREQIAFPPCSCPFPEWGDTRGNLTICFIFG